MTDNNDHPVYRGDFLQGKGGTCDCTVSCDIAGAEFPEFYHATWSTASKVHICDECGLPIFPGTQYHRSRGKWDGHFETHKVCPVCVEIQSTFFPSGHVLGEMYDELHNYVDDTDGEIPENCLRDLSADARNRVLDIIEKRWAI